MNPRGMVLVPSESLEQYATQFLHLYYELLDEDVDWHFLDENFCFLVTVLRKYFESNSSRIPIKKEFKYH